MTNRARRPRKDSRRSATGAESMDTCPTNAPKEKEKARQSCAGTAGIRDIRNGCAHKKAAKEKASNGERDRPKEPMQLTQAGTAGKKSPKRKQEIRAKAKDLEEEKSTRYSSGRSRSAEQEGAKT